ncbi:uncharacterized protein N7506_005645 [Penicillium brevicompactum]|uniref:uncharacterized protein n=1 Tax=Penicillium brevicompactum TaxID=5074 RepID=UPI002540BF6C|nr:uncharacterized protein N7506_005645 [Penicillium brevicompactum]KAJ5335709.1 hypothetical protein N7506_005645 [Penicillium brevicompactum]
MAARLTYCKDAFQTFNWTETKTSAKIAKDAPRTAIGEDGSARNLVVALLGQTYTLCPEPQRFHFYGLSSTYSLLLLPDKRIVAAME